MILPANQLEKLCAEAQKDIVLVAPFIKASVLERLLLKVSIEVKVRCVTRWYPEEIVAGVSDLEVWSIIKARPNSSIWLRHNLHAKFYRGDEQCLVGSANLTASALGWSNYPNFELLVTLQATDTTLRTFETELLAGCVQVDEGLFEQMSSMVKVLNQHYQQTLSLPLVEPETSIKEDLPSQKTLVNTWLPILRNPKDLYLAYSGQYDKLTTASKNAGLSDLQALRLIPNLPKDVFEAYVGIILLQKPIIRQIDVFVAIPQRFGAVRDFLSSLPCAELPEFDAERAWQTLMRWLHYFLPNRYILSTPNYSEFFCRVQTNSE